eukprot:5115348-Pyramimonas_sp.AAC.1
MLAAQESTIANNETNSKSGKQEQARAIYDKHPPPCPVHVEASQGYDSPTRLTLQRARPLLNHP